MPWAASQVAWAGSGVLGFLVVPASRRRREAGRHRGLRGPKAIADQVVVCERFPEGVRPQGAGRPRASWAAATGARLANLLSLSLRPGTTGSEGGGAGSLGIGSGKRHGLTLCGCRAGYGGAGVVSPGGDGGGGGRGGDGGTGHGRVIRDCRRGDASAVAGRLAAGAQPQENQGEGDGEGDDD